MKQNKDFKFDKRASSYDKGIEGIVSKRFYKLLLNEVKTYQNINVLDVGCGTGTILKSLNEFTQINGYGIDVEQNMIKEAKLKCPNMNIIVSSCTNTPFEDNKFDIITSCMAYHHFDNKDAFAKEASRILKPNGFVYIVDPRFPWIVRKPMNLAFRIHKIAGYFGTPVEIERVFEKYGFKLIDSKFDMYAQCIVLEKFS